MNLLYLIISIFALGIIIGSYLLSLVLRKKDTPKAASITHGMFVICALILLIYYSSRHRPGLTESIILFAVAALGGITLIFRDITGRSLPPWLAIGHGLAAIAGFIFLLMSTIT